MTAAQLAAAGWLSPTYAATRHTTDPMRGPAMFVSATTTRAAVELRRPRQGERKPRPARPTARRLAIAEQTGARR